MRWVAPRWKSGSTAPCRWNASGACRRSPGPWRKSPRCSWRAIERELVVLDDSDDVHEVILAAAPQEALTLIEDEVLLALPFAPRCERPECAGQPVHSRRSGRDAIVRVCGARGIEERRRREGEELNARRYEAHRM